MNKMPVYYGSFVNEVVVPVEKQLGLLAEMLNQSSSEIDLIQARRVNLLRTIIDKMRSRWNIQFNYVGVILDENELTIHPDVIGVDNFINAVEAVFVRFHDEYMNLPMEEFFFSPVELQILLATLAEGALLCQQIFEDNYLRE